MEQEKNTRQENFTGYSACAGEHTLPDPEKLCSAVKTIAWGYVLLHLNINLGTLNILPNWLGYLLLLSALPAIGTIVPSANLLRPLGILLAIWEGLLWAAALLGITFHGYVLEVIATVIGLYFHFQLLANLADVAKTYDCPESKRILNLRTVRTVLITLLALPLPWEKYTGAAILILVIHLIVAIWICSVLFSLRRSLLQVQPDVPRSSEN